jgi:hypothetical protein
MLDPCSPAVAARLRDEGVPAEDVRAVATQLNFVLPFATTTGSDVAVVALDPWSIQLIARYGDKLASLFMTSRGKVETR